MDVNEASLGQKGDQEQQAGTAGQDVAVVPHQNGVSPPSALPAFVKGDHIVTTASFDRRLRACPLLFAPLSAAFGLLFPAG